MHWMFDSAHCVLLDQEFEAVSRLTLDFVGQVLDGASAGLDAQGFPGLGSDL
jgi:hypothetical protein